jgi:hypothetical protein
MTKSLRKKVVKQQSRLAALNLLGTPSGSRAGSEVEDDSDTSLVISTHSIHQTDPVSIQDDLRHCIDELGEKSVA